MREDVRYHIALGCALAGRAAALAQATADRIPFSFDQAKYQKWMTAWEAAQKDANSPGYGKPRPESPTLLTKDDQLPFVMTREEASSQFRALSDEALTEWETALAQAKTLQERAEMDYLRAWGRELLRVYGESANWRDLPGAKENTRLLQEATELAPKNPLYWQSLGDMHMDLSASLDHAKDKPGALSAYRQSLKLKKTNANLWYRIYDLCKLDNPEQAEEAMRRAAQADSENAYPAYRLAGLLFLKTPYGDFSREITRIARAPFKPGEDTLPTLGKKIVDATDYDQKRQEAEKALAVVDQGNRAQQYAPPVYAPPFPVLLKAAWNFREGSYYLDNTTDIRDWHTISVSIGGYMRVMALQGDKEAAVSAARTLIAMGAKIAGDLADKPLPLPRDEKYRLDNGFSIAQTGYGWLVEGFKAAGDSMSAAEFDPEYQQFIARHTQYLEADKKAREHSYTGF
ncbi:MAG: hypothetical protein JWL77_4847 [Chthonomonadaceae bacterium]|nr:hypothetical protein [Chthonomonadaceae bacterium]